MAIKPAKHPDYEDIKYSAHRWILLDVLRKKALQLMKPLYEIHLDPIVHGSIARGDVSENSDIDIFVQPGVSSFIIETALEKARSPVNERLIVQATPTYAMKAHVQIDESSSVSFPLMKLRKVEREFYKFGGELDFEGLEKNSRVAGVDKRLMLIEPNDKGHTESTIIGHEEYVAKLLGISVETVLDRVHALLRRDDVGRTGVFIKEELSQNETFEMALNRLAKDNPAVRRRLTSKI